MKTTALSDRLYSWLFYAVVYVFSFSLAIFSLPFLLLPKKFMYYISLFWAHRILWLASIILKLDFTLQGKIPSTPCIVAAKHQSAWETVALYALLKCPVFILKRELFYIPFIGLCLKKMGMIAISRKRKNKKSSLINQANALLQTQRHLVIFPEGTRTTYGETPPLKTGVWHLYRQLNRPLLPVFLDSGRYWPRKSLVKKSGKVKIVLHKLLPAHTHTQFTQKNFLTLIHQKINTAEREAY